MLHVAILTKALQNGKSHEARGQRSGRRLSVRLVPVVRNNVMPLVGRGARHKGHDRFGVAHVEDFVRHAGLDVNEIASFILNHLLEPGPNSWRTFPSTI